MLKQEIGFEAALEAKTYIYLNRCLNTSSLINNFILKNENSVDNLFYNDVCVVSELYCTYMILNKKKVGV